MMNYVIQQPFFDATSVVAGVLYSTRNPCERLEWLKSETLNPTTSVLRKTLLAITQGGVVPR